MPPDGGTSVTSDELLDGTPCSVTGLLMVTCSGYVPGHTSTIVGAGVEFSASWILVNRVPTLQVPTITVVAARNSGAPAFNTHAETTKSMNLSRAMSWVSFFA